MGRGSIQAREPELEKTGLIQPVVLQTRPRLVRWELTKMGRDTIPVLMGLISFGAKWYPEVVFTDGKRHSFEELFPQIDPIKIE